jgi:hypothetical protein
MGEQVLFPAIEDETIRIVNGQGGELFRADYESDIYTLTLSDNTYELTVYGTGDVVWRSLAPGLPMDSDALAEKFVEKAFNAAR